MKSFVDIEGSSRNVSTIQGAGNLSGVTGTGVVVGASSAELRNLTLRGVGSGSRPFVIPLFNGSSSPTVRDVAIVSSGGTNHWGIRNLDASPTVEDVSITVTATGSFAYGISNNGPSSPKIRRTEINVTNSAGGGDTIGIFWDGFGVSVDLRELRIDVSGTSVAYGVLSNGGIVLTIEDSAISARTASTTYGISMQSGSLFVSQSKIRGLGAGGTGIHSPSFASATIDHSEVAGDVATVSIGVAQIGATLLDGGPVSNGSETCAGVYDESYTFFASTCP